MTEAGPPQALSSGAVFALMAGVFAVTIGYGIVLPILPFLVERAVAAPQSATVSGHTGLLAATYTLSLFLFAPLWGRLSDRGGRWRFLILGLSGYAVMYALLAFVSDLTLLYVGRFLSGAFASAVTPVAYALVGERTLVKERRARRFALLTIAESAGFFVGPMVGGLALSAGGVVLQRSDLAVSIMPFLATSGLAIVAAILIVAFGRSETGARVQNVAPSQIAPDWAAISRLLWVGFVAAAAVGAFEVGLSLRGTQILDWSAYEMGILFAECSIVMFAAQALVFSPLVKLAVMPRFVTPSLIVLAIGLLGVPVADSYLATMLAVALIAASAGILAPIATYWTSLSAGGQQGAALGRQTAATNLGQTVGSGIAGLLFGITVLPNASFILPAVLVATGLVAALRLPRLLNAVVSADTANARKEPL